MSFGKVVAWLGGGGVVLVAIIGVIASLVRFDTKLTSINTTVNKNHHRLVKLQQNTFTVTTRLNTDIIPRLNLLLDDPLKIKDIELGAVSDSTLRPLSYTGDEGTETAHRLAVLRDSLETAMAEAKTDRLYLAGMVSALTFSICGVLLWLFRKKLPGSRSEEAPEGELRSAVAQEGEASTETVVIPVRAEDLGAMKRMGPEESTKFMELIQQKRKSTGR